jgi:tRNA U34 5-carboxymethylaminomethyl modifying GTPase MnmE/TrmE
MGSPRVGKSSLINALCGNNEAKTSSSLNPCTPNTTCYVLEDNQQRHPFKINFYDTPGIESWTDRAGEKKMLELIEQTNPVCVIYCASPGSAAKLDQLHSVLDDCKKRQIFCALVCTNMWSDYKRHEVIKEFEKQLQFFGDKRDETSQSPLYRIPTKITFFGNGALCTMVNSKEYSDPDLSNQVMPVQGIDELIHGIMESLDEEKLLGWCYAVLDRRSYWEKITQKIGGFFKLRLTNLYKLITSSPEQTAMNFLAYFLNQFISEKKT